MNRESASVAIVGWTVLGIVLITLFIAKCQMEENRLFVEAGYCKEGISGGSYRWAKCKESN